MRILVVDDEESIRVALAFLLERAGHRVEVAPTGEEALRRLEGEVFDLLVLDLRLPGMDGFALLERARGFKVPPKVLVLSARDREADRAKALALGAQAFLGKPFRVEDLLAQVGLLDRGP